MAHSWNSRLQNGNTVMVCRYCHQGLVNNQAFKFHVECHMGTWRQPPSYDVNSLIGSVPNTNCCPISCPMSMPRAAPLQENMISANNGRTFQTLPLRTPQLAPPPARTNRNFSISLLSPPRQLQRLIQHAPPCSCSVEENNVHVTTLVIDLEFYRRRMEANGRIDDGTEPYIKLMEKPIKIDFIDLDGLVDLSLKLNSLE